MEKEELIAFTNEIKELFDAGKIKSPVHLSMGNEEQLIKIFEQVKPQDWVFSTHRSHYHALLKGIPKEWLKNEILENRSIHISNKQYKFFSSAIVGGICPIATGTALGLRLKDSNEHVWCFVGDMAARTGIFYESVRYAEGFDLPVTFVVEDNDLSVNTPTSVVWGNNNGNHKIKYYEYTRLLPHSGGGKWIKF